MSFISESVTFDLVTLLITAFFLIIAYFKWKFSYWDRVGLASLKPSIPFGNVKGLFTRTTTFADTLLELYNEIKSKRLPHAGIYMSVKPVYVPIDPKILKSVLLKNFSHFVNHGGYINEENDPLSGTLFNLEDEKWRKMRVKLTPTFTSGKMKMMFPTLVECGPGLTDLLNEFVTTKTPVDIKEPLARYTTDIIGSCAFGIECNSLKDPDSEFRKYGKRIAEDTIWEGIKNVLQAVLPRNFLDFVKFKFTKPDVETFFMDAIKKTVDYREKYQVYRKDFMHLLLQLKNRGVVTDDEKITTDSEKVEPALTLNELSAHCFGFFLGGFGTSSTTMTFALYELAVNPEIQEKLRTEVKEVLGKHEGKLTYDAMTEMAYLDKIVKETLRKYPPLPFLPRICNKNYKVPETDVTIKKGTLTLISIVGLHRDPEYYPNPEIFDPERFSAEEIKKRPQFAWIPFGEGPRICIGSRFGTMQTKVGLAIILKNYVIKLNGKTRTPIEMDKKAVAMTAAGGIWLDLERAH